MNSVYDSFQCRVRFKSLSAVYDTTGFRLLCVVSRHRQHHGRNDRFREILTFASGRISKSASTSTAEIREPTTVIKSTKQPDALDEPDARTTPIKPFGGSIGVGCVRFVGLIWGLLLGKVLPLSACIAQIICPRIPRRFRKGPPGLSRCNTGMHLWAPEWPPGRKSRRGMGGVVMGRPERDIQGAVEDDDSVTCK